MPKTEEYEREAKALTDFDVQSAISYSKSKHITGKVAEWRDTKTQGLTLRIRSGAVVWFIRRRNITLRMGLASEITLGDARYFAEQTKLAAGRKRDLREFLNTLVSITLNSFKDGSRNVDLADQLADETSLLAYRKRFGDDGAFWTWKTLTHKFLEYKKPKLKATYRDDSSTI